MKTLQKTAKDRVIETLLENLCELSPEIEWIPKHPYVVDYIQAMDESHRVYHGWIHVVEMLRELDELPPGIVNDPVRLRAAIIFHDVVCIPLAQDNEGKSTLFASKFYSGRNIAIISNLILATTHTFPFTYFGDDRDVMCDLDLIILGASRERFDSYRMDIAQEYRGYCTLEEFHKGSNEFFQKLLNESFKNSIYRTEFFRRQYEWRARENFKRLLGII